jgi:hypothetical protein
MNARNFGLRSRDIAMAAKNALIEGLQSYSSIATMTSRFRKFSEWEMQTYGVKDLRWISKEHLEAYAIHMADTVKKGQLEVSTAHNYISAVNRVMQIARADKQVHVKASEYLDNRTSICTVNKAFTQVEIDKINQIPIISSYTENQKLIGHLTDQFGLRFKECCLLNIKQVIYTAINEGRIRVELGTKGGRARYVPVRTYSQIIYLQKAVQLQGKGRSLIPVTMNYREWKDKMYKLAEKADIRGWHGGRHAYAQRRYYELTGVQCPVVVGIQHGSHHIHYIASQLNISFQAAKEKDKRVRKIVAKELGHRRIDITDKYLG